MQWCDRRSIVTKKISLLAMLLSLSMVFSYFEARFPIITWIPGAKLGLANIVVMVALYEIGTKEAWCLSVLRVILTGFLFGNFVAVLFSLAGAFLSLGGMSVLKRYTKISMMYVSISGGILHNLGQIIVASNVLENQKIWYYFPMLFFSGIIAGTMIGFLGYSICKKIKKFNRM